MLTKSFTNVVKPEEILTLCSNPEKLINEYIYIYIKEIIKKIYIGKNRKEIFWVSSVVRVVFLQLGIFWNKRIPGMSLLFTNEVVISVNLPQCLGFRSQKGGRIWLFREYIQFTTKSSK